jgi:hypothetical protein
LFPSKRNSDDFINFKADKRKKYNSEQKAAKENVARIETQRKFDLEQKEKEKAEAKKQQEWHDNETFVIGWEIQPPKERRKTFAIYRPEMMLARLDSLTPDQLERIQKLMSASERKRFGVMTQEETMKQNLGVGKILKTIR